MAEVEEVHPEGVEWVEFDPVPIDTDTPVTWDDAQEPYTSHRVRLRVCFLGIGERVETLAEDVLQQCTPGTMCDGHDLRTLLASVLVDNVANSCRDI